MTRTIRVASKVKMYPACKQHRRMWKLTSLYAWMCNAMLEHRFAHLDMMPKSAVTVMEKDKKTGKMKPKMRKDKETGEEERIIRMKTISPVQLRKEGHEDPITIPSKMEQVRQFRSLKHLFPDTEEKEMYGWTKTFPSRMIEAAAEDVEDSWTSMYGGKSGKRFGRPQFKSVRRRRRARFSFECGVKDDGHVIIPTVGEVRYRQKGRLPVTTKKKADGTTEPYRAAGTIEWKNGAWWFSFSYEVEVEVEDRPRNVVGVDVGVLNIAASSQGMVFPRVDVSQIDRRIRHFQRLTRRRQGGRNPSNRWRRARAKLNRLIAKRTAILQHARHTATSRIVKGVDGSPPSIIVLEKLNTSGMGARKPGMGKAGRAINAAIKSAAMYEVQRQIEYKAAWAGIEVVRADTWYASSKICSGCGEKNKSLTLEDRMFSCPSCGLEVDRDLNAAINLSRYPDTDEGREHLINYRRERDEALIKAAAAAARRAEGRRKGGARKRAAAAAGG